MGLLPLHYQFCDTIFSDLSKFHKVCFLAICLNPHLISVLYKDGPCVSHADYIVVIKSHIRQDDWMSILGHVRMATTTVKVTILLFYKLFP